MIDNKLITFEKFAKKAVQKMEERRKHKKKTFYVGDLEENIEIRGISEQEFIECSEYSENDFEVDKYTLYYASPTLQELAKYMMENKMIKDYIDVCDAISPVDRKQLVREIIKLSGLTEESTVKELEEIKNG